MSRLAPGVAPAPAVFVLRFFEDHTEADAADLLGVSVNTVKTQCWSPDGARLLVAAPEPGVLTVATGASGTIPGGLTGQDLRWSGDGGKLAYLSGGRLTATGAIEVIPVPGDVQAAVFDTEGKLPVRAKDGDRMVLSVFSASGTLLVQAAEPGSVKDLELLACTR